MASGLVLRCLPCLCVHDLSISSAPRRTSNQRLIWSLRSAVISSTIAVQARHRRLLWRQAARKPSVQTAIRTQAGGDAAGSGVAFGPRGAFLVGFTAKDGADVAAWFASVEPGFPVSHCSNELLPLSLGEALYADYRDPLANLVTPAADAGTSLDGTSPLTAAPSSAASGEARPAPAPDTSSPVSGDSSSRAAASTVGSQRPKGSGMRPVGADLPEPKQFRVHAYTELLPMPRIAILSGLSEREWVGICELWDTTGLPQPIFASVTQRMLTIPLGNLLDRVAEEYARNDAVSASGPPPSVIDVERVRSKLEHIKSRKAAASTPSGASSSEQQPANQQQAARARAALDKRLASSGGRLKVVDFMSGAPQQRPAAGPQQAPEQLTEAEAEAQRDEERFAALRRKAGKLARQERRTLASKGDAAPQPRGFS